MDEKRDDIRINSKVNFYGPVIFFIGVPTIVLPLVLFIIWMSNNWRDALLLSTVLTYGVAGVIAVFLICATSLIIAFTITRISHWNNKRNLLTYGEIAILLKAGGDYEHLSAQHESAKLPEAASVTVEEVPEVSDDTILDLWRKGLSLRTIEKATGVKYNRIQKVTSETKGK